MAVVDGGYYSNYNTGPTSLAASSTDLKAADLPDFNVISNAGRAYLGTVDWEKELPDIFGLSLMPQPADKISSGVVDRPELLSTKKVKSVKKRKIETTDTNDDETSSKKPRSENVFVCGVCGKSHSQKANQCRHWLRITRKLILAGEISGDVSLIDDKSRLDATREIGSIECLYSAKDYGNSNGVERPAGHISTQIPVGAFKSSRGRPTKTLPLFGVAAPAVPAAAMPVVAVPAVAVPAVPVAEVAPTFMTATAPTFTTVPVQAASIVRPATSSSIVVAPLLTKQNTTNPTSYFNSSFNSIANDDKIPCDWEIPLGRWADALNDDDTRGISVTELIDQYFGPAN